jgi:hypothetical protein
MKWKVPKRNGHKYNAKATVVDGFRFDSKKEAAHYKRNKLLLANGDMIMQLRQTPLHLPDGVVYRLDFMEFYSDGTILFIDVKGRDTPMSKLKRGQVEYLYPHIKITLV